MDKCKWTYDLDDRELHYTSCLNHIRLSDLYSPGSDRHFNFCPYCGNEIEVNAIEQT